MRRGALVVAVLVFTSRLAGQTGPRIVLGLSASDSGAPAAVVRLAGLLDDDRFFTAIRAGFPLYVAVTVQLRASRTLWDREVDRVVREYVVHYDPVREVYLLEDDEGTTEEIPDREALARQVGRTYVMSIDPDGRGRFHYQATITARTLSDEEVDDVYAWLRGEDADTARRGPGLITRMARKLLVQMAPLPRLSLEATTDDFEVR